MHPDPQTQPEFMSRQESRRLVLMGIVLLLLLAYLINGALRPASSEDAGVPVRLGSREGGAPAGGELGYDPSTPLARPSQDPLAAKRALEARLRAEREGKEAGAAQPFEPSDERLQQVRDLAVDVVEEPGFYELIARVHRMGEEELERAPERYGTFERRDLLPPPGFDVRRARETGEFPHLDRLRGRFVRLRGRFATPLFQRVLERYPNESGLAWVWQGTFLAGNRPYFVTVTDKPFDPKSGPRGEPIELVGAFLKLYSFTPTNPELGVKTVPHLVAKSFRRVPPAPRWDYMNDRMLYAGAAVILVLAFAVFVYARVSARGTAELERWRRKHFMARAKREVQAAVAGARRETAPGAKAGGAEPGGTEAGAEPGGMEAGGAEPGAEAGAEPAAEAGAEPAAEAGAEPAAEACAEPAAEAGAEAGDAEPGAEAGAEAGGAEAGGAEAGSEAGGSKAEGAPPPA